jgi:hypothetical protein
MFTSSNETSEIDAALSLFKSKMLPVKRSNDVAMKGTSKAGKEYEVKYEYAPLEVIQEQVRPILSENGLTINQFLSYIELKEGITEAIVTRIGHKSGQWHKSIWPIDMTGTSKEQDRGSKLTYNKRYCYAAALDIALIDEDDDAVGVQVGDAKQKQEVKSKTVDPKGYALKAGKNKGVFIVDMKDDDVINYVNYIQKIPDVKGALLDDLNAMKKHIETKNIIPF